MIKTASKDIRNLIITLLILGIGARLILYITERYVNIAAAGGIGQSLNEIGIFLFYGAIVLALLLVPFWLSSRSNEKKRSAE